YWGHNPSNSWLTHATGALEAKERGARLIVVDPRHAGLANKADLWLRVRPGSDGALALALAGVMIEEGWYDREFMRKWSNGPLLINPATCRFLTAADLRPHGNARAFVAWDEVRGHPVLYDPERSAYESDSVSPILLGKFSIETVRGTLECPTAFEMFRRLCA